MRRHLAIRVRKKRRLYKLQIHAARVGLQLSVFWSADMTFPIKVTAKCPECLAQLLFPDDATRSTRIVCDNCGNDLGTYGELEDAAVDTIASKLHSSIHGAKD